MLLALCGRPRRRVRRGRGGGPAPASAHRYLPGAGLEDASALFRHEVAYCLGQRQDAAAVGALTALLCDAREHPMCARRPGALWPWRGTGRRASQPSGQRVRVLARPLEFTLLGSGAARQRALQLEEVAALSNVLRVCRVRHEAGEALGAIGTPECVAALAAGAADACLVVAQTCQLALQRVQHLAAAARENGGAAVRPVERERRGRAPSWAGVRARVCGLRRALQASGGPSAGAHRSAVRELAFVRAY